MTAYGPDPSAVYPNPLLKSICYIKNVITRPNIIVGDYTYYSDERDAAAFETHVTHHYEFLGDRLRIRPLLRHRAGHRVHYERRQSSDAQRYDLSLQPVQPWIGSAARPRLTSFRSRAIRSWGMTSGSVRT